MVSQAIDKWTTQLATRMNLDAGGAARLSQAIIPTIFANAIQYPIDVFCTPLSERVIRAAVGTGFIGASFLPKGLNPRNKTDLFTMGMQMLTNAIRDTLTPEQAAEFQANLYAVKNGVQYGSPESVIRGLFKMPTKSPSFANTVAQLKTVFSGASPIKLSQPQLPIPAHPMQEPPMSAVAKYAEAPDNPIINWRMRQPEGTDLNTPIF